MEGLASVKVLRRERVGRLSGIGGRLLAEPRGKVAGHDVRAESGTSAWKAMGALAKHQDFFLCGREPVKCFKQRNNVIYCVFQNLLKQSVLVFSKIHVSMSLHSLSPGISFLRRVYLSVSHEAFEV